MIFLVATLHAQDWSFTRTVWQMQDGLPENMVQAITQDSNGYLWVATTGGLTKFDGAHFIPLGSTPRKLVVNSVFSVTAAPDGSIWAGTEGGGLLHIKDGRTEILGRNEGLTDDFVRSIIVDHGGKVWIGTDSGLFTYQGRRIQRVDQPRDSLQDGIHSISEDREGRVWIGGGDLYSLRDNVRQSYVLPGKYSESRVKAVLQTSDGTHWVGTVSGLLRQVGGRFEPVAQIHETVRVLTQTADGTLWIGTIGQGLWTYKDGRLTRVDRGTLLPTSTVLSIFEDRSRNLWIGTQDGLVRLERTPVAMIPIKANSDADFGTISSNGAGESWMVANQVYRIYDNVAHPFTFSHLQISMRNVMRASDGSLWIGTDGSGAYHLVNGTLVHYAAPAQLTNNFIRGFLETSKNEVWIATDNGVSRFAGNGIHKYGMAEGLAHFSTRCLFEDRRHDVWIGTDQGLSHFRDDRFIASPVTQELAQEKIWSILEDHSGALWFGTRDHGLFRLSQGALEHLTTANGLLSNSIYQILEDKQKRLWISGPDTISSVDISKIAPGRVALLGVQRYEMPFQAADAQLYGGRQPAGYLAKDDSVWFATSRGAAHIKARSETSEKPLIRIEKVVVDSREVPLDSAMTLPSGASRLTIYFAPLLLSSQEGLGFRYMLQGFETSWTNAGASRSATYTNLPAGRYRFRVEVFDGSHPDAVTETEYRFAKAPHIYQRAWFLLLCLLFVAAAVLLIYRFRVRQLRVRFNAVLQERNRLAREMHDTVIQGCTSTSALLEALASVQSENDATSSELLGYARLQIRTTIDEARDAVWDLRHERNASVDLRPRLEAIAQEASRAFNIPVECQVPREVVTVAASVAHEVSMIIRESLANAGTHADAEQITLYLASTNGSLQISITDDGRGFLAQEAPGVKDGHFGLTGIRERTRRLGGTVSIVGVPQTGTRVELSVPPVIKAESKEYVG